MFQYACGRTLSIRRNERLILYIGIYLRPGSKRKCCLDAFNVEADIVEDHECLKEVNLLWTASEVDFGFHRAVPENSSKNVLLNGSWESEYYFAGSADVIRKELSFKRALGADRQAMLSNITSGPSVCLHLRRTDILANTGHKGFVGLEYYRNSMEHMYKYVANPACYVFSDDTRWCGDNLPSGHSYVFAFVDEPDDPAAVKELNLMTHCQHFIVANSTFSGWGAWLAKNPGKLVIRPRRWFRNDLQPTWHAEMRSYLRSNDLIPAAWRRL